MRYFTRSDLVEGNALLQHSVSKTELRQRSLDSGIADEEEGPLILSFARDLDCDMSEDEDEDLIDEDL